MIWTRMTALTHSSNNNLLRKEWNTHGRFSLWFLCHYDWATIIIACVQVVRAFSRQGGHCPYGGGCSPDRNETVVVVIEEIPQLWVDVWTQPRQSNHATEMTISHRLGKQVKTATILIENSLSVVVVVSFCFQTSTETRTIRFYWAHSRWLTQFALGRADNAISSSSSTVVVVSAQCFLRNFQRDKRMPMSFFFCLPFVFLVFWDLTILSLLLMFLVLY